MCHECKAKQREIDALRAGMSILRDQNIKMAVENNNLRNMTGVKMRPICAGDYLTNWEREQEGGAA